LIDQSRAIVQNILKALGRILSTILKIGKGTLRRSYDNISHLSRDPPDESFICCNKKPATSYVIRGFRG